MSRRISLLPGRNPLASAQGRSPPTCSCLTGTRAALRPPSKTRGGGRQRRRGRAAFSTQGEKDGGGSPGPAAPRPRSPASKEPAAALRSPQEHEAGPPSPRPTPPAPLLTSPPPPPRGRLTKAGGVPSAPHDSGGGGDAAAEPLGPHPLSRSPATPHLRPPLTCLRPLGGRQLAALSRGSWRPPEPRGAGAHRRR